ncbi:MAG: sigma-70 family RNA polymerase sigma factor [Sedimentisphaerales bacterium]|nr:sigma-70 family RNA polymerase sigma factor [Sedimentisphaerales bacterium]
MLEDRILLRRLRAADSDALQLIYEKYADDLLAVAASLLSDIHAAEDCLSDVFVRLVGNAGSLKIRFNLKAYLMCCVANRARDYLRKQERKPDCQPDTFENPAKRDNPLARLIEDEQAAALLDALVQLPYQQREVFVLHVRGGLNFPRIAGLLDVSVNTVRSRYRYSVDKLRSLLNKGELL